MTDQVLNAAIAEEIRDRPGAPTGDLDFCNDLNAMHKVESLLTADEWQRYRSLLWEIAAGSSAREFETKLRPHLPRHFTRGRAYSAASAYQRALAFYLSAMGMPAGDRH